MGTIIKKKSKALTTIIMLNLKGLMRECKNGFWGGSEN